MKKPAKDNHSFGPLIGGLVFLAAVAAGIWYFNSGYGKTSAKGYQFATALFSACNRQDEAKLQQIAEMIEQSQQTDELSVKDAKVLTSIVNRGLAGNWRSASRETRRLMEAQLVPASSADFPAKMHSHD